MDSSNDSDCFEIDEATQPLESIASLTQKLNILELMVHHLTTRVAILEGKEFKHGNVMATTSQNYPVEWALKSQKDFNTYAEQKINNLKHDNEWRKNFMTINFDGVTSENKDKILASINKTRISVSRIVNTIAKEIIGPKTLTTHSLGSHGMAIINSSPGKAPRPTIDEKLENKLRSVVGFIDPIFVSRDGWEYLVRRPVNQMCREFKSGKRSVEEPSSLTSKSMSFQRDGHNMAITDPASLCEQTLTIPTPLSSTPQNEPRLVNRLSSINSIHQRLDSGLLPRSLFPSIDKESSNINAKAKERQEPFFSGRKYY